MKFSITVTTNNKRPLTFADLAEGDVFIIGKDYESSMFVKLNRTLGSGGNFYNSFYNAVSLTSGNGVDVKLSAPVKKLIKEISLSESDFTDTLEPDTVTIY